MKLTKLSEEIGNLLKEVSYNRDFIKDAFAKAYLSAYLDDFPQPINQAIKNIELVEQWSPDRLSVSWYFREKTIDQMSEDKK